MRKVYCDHCGKEIRKQPFEVVVQLNGVHQEAHDLCAGCANDFIEALNKFYKTIDNRRKK